MKIEGKPNTHCGNPNKNRRETYGKPHGKAQFTFLEQLYKTQKRATEATPFKFLSFAMPPRCFEYYLCFLVKTTINTSPVIISINYKNGIKRYYYFCLSNNLFISSENYCLFIIGYFVVPNKSQ